MYPCLLCASEALPFNFSKLKSLGFPPKRILLKCLTLVLFISLANAKNSLISPDVSELMFRRKSKIQLP